MARLTARGKTLRNIVLWQSATRGLLRQLEKANITPIGEVYDIDDKLPGRVLSCEPAQTLAEIVIENSATQNTRALRTN